MNIKPPSVASPHRYDQQETIYRRCGNSGVLLPTVSLGFWHNFGATDPYTRSRDITHYAFDHGITHFDLANNYGPPSGTAEETMGRLPNVMNPTYEDYVACNNEARAYAMSLI